MRRFVSNLVRSRSVGMTTLRANSMRAGVLLVLGLGASNIYAQTLTTLASFNGSNGEEPVVGLTVAGNSLYGTTYYGGTYGDGTVFSLPLSGGSLTVLASFKGSNGANPYGGLTVVGNNLYGTTIDGGANSNGTVFSLPLSGGSLTVLASLSWSNGVQPECALTAVGNRLYGTTQYGGNLSLNDGNGCGTVFSLPLSGGSLTVLASFNGSNGSNPVGPLTVVGNTLYGTARYGGPGYTGGPYGNGTVFSLPLSGGSLTALASFNYNSNGANPEAGVTVLGNSLYGTTTGGGDTSLYGGANLEGTVFSLPLGGGSLTVLTAFGNHNGAVPLSLTVVGNSLYGTTVEGGPGYTGASGRGTVFSIPLSGGSPTIVASFSGSNGYSPNGGLTVVGNSLYGTTAYGGSGYNGNADSGDGTVFALSIPGYYVWNVVSSGSWSATGNWNPAGPPDGVGNTADFSQQTLAADATVTLDGSHTIGNLIFGDQGNAHNWTLAAGSGGTLTLQVSSGTPTITVNNQTATIAAVLAGSQGLAKFGTGTLVLAASNTYTGPTTINQGKLAVDGSLTGSPVTVNSGGILSGTGSLTSVTVYSGGTLAPGDPQGVLHLSGNLNLASGAALDYDLDGVPTHNEILMPTGQLILSDQQFSDFNFTTQAGFGEGTYILIDAELISGSLGNDLSGTVNGLSATLAVQGNDLVLNVVPEPSTLVLLAAGAMGLLGWAWRLRLTRSQRRR